MHMALITKCRVYTYVNTKGDKDNNLLAIYFIREGLLTANWGMASQL